MGIGDDFGDWFVDTFVPGAGAVASAASVIGETVDTYEDVPLPEKWNSLTYHTIKPTVGLLDFSDGPNKTKEEAVYVHLIGAGGRYGDEMAKGMDPAELARIRNMHSKLIKYSGQQWYKEWWTTAGINARAKSAFEADQHEKVQLKLYYENRLKHALKAEMIKLLEEANIEGRREHRAKYRKGTIGTWTANIQNLYNLIAKCCPFLLSQMNNIEDGFEWTKKGLDAFQQWVDDNDIPVLDEIRDYYAWKLEMIQAIGEIPGVDELSKALFGKKLSEMDYIDMVDSGAQMANPGYAMLRSGMELNKQLREQMEAKDKLEENEWLDLYSHYLVELLESYQIPEQAIDNGEIEGFDTSMEPSLMLTQSIRPGYIKPPDANTDLITRLPGSGGAVVKDSVVIEEVEKAENTEKAKKKKKRQQQRYGGGMGRLGNAAGGKDLPNIYGT